ncbi:hypothetical protein JY97_00495 [Alkalispirochaeta odontotermitis]|nr:hypothetical protein JY97_00495 [Alkalispirochaeta odontotermitis]
MNHQLTNTFYRAKVGAQYIHQSLQCLTPHKQWAWTGTEDRVKALKRKCKLASDAKIQPIIKHLDLKTNGVLS